MHLPAHRKVGTIVFVGCVRSRGRILSYFYKKKEVIAFIVWPTTEGRNF